MPGEEEVVLVVADVAMAIGKSLYNLITAKKAEDRKAALDDMKAAISDGETRLAALPGELAADDKQADADVDKKFPPPAEPLDGNGRNS